MPPFPLTPPGIANNFDFHVWIETKASWEEIFIPCRTHIFSANVATPLDWDAWLTTYVAQWAHGVDVLSLRQGISCPFDIQVLECDEELLFTTHDIHEIIKIDIALVLVPEAVSP